MVEENKYYTPEISEFHVGFEYEYRWFINVEENGSGYVVTRADSTRIINEWSDWEKLDVPIKLDYQGFQDCSPYNHNDLNTDRHQFRVKYLDKEDIESLGWYSNHKDFYYYICKEVTYTLNVLSNNFGSNKIEIRCASNPSLNYSNYLGECKNKSELIKLMKQLNIK